MNEARTSGAGARVTTLLFLGLAFSACSYLQPESSLQNTVSELNKKCPVMIDSETRLDRIAVETGPSLSYYYSLVNVEASKVDTHRFRLAVTPGLLSTIRVTEGMKQLRDQQVIFRYYYADRRRVPILTVKFVPSDYQ